MSRATVLFLMGPFFALVIFAFLYPAREPALDLRARAAAERWSTTSGWSRIPSYARVLMRTLQIALLVGLLSSRPVPARSRS